MPEEGVFSPIDAHLKHDPANMNTIGKIRIMIGPFSNDGSKEYKFQRYVDLILETKTGLSKSSMWICSGTKKEILQFLEAEETASKILAKIKTLAEGLEEFR